MPLESGFLTTKEAKQLAAYPSEERFAQGPVAIIECAQDIPCNPCETSCPFGAIKVGEPITNIPQFHEDLCTGCMRCVARCPGLAIFVVDKTYAFDLATVSFPHEYLPLPEKGSTVEAVDRQGNVVCSAEVLRVAAPKAYDRTAVVTIVVPKQFADDVRGMKRLQRGD